MAHTSRLKSLFAIVATLFLSLGLTSAPVAQAQGTQIAPTMVILDASGSMLADDAGGQRRIDAAKDATHQFLGGVSESSELGLMTYGTGTSNAPEEREAGCRDVTLLAPSAGQQLGDLRSQVDSIEASGYTPMGPALEQAAAQLPAEGERSIVLVSDGIDTCAPPPVCEIAAGLKADGVDIVINTVGFLVDEEARAELECIADAGGGRYLDAGDSDSLAQSLQTLTTRSINAYESDLELIDGGDSEANAAEIPAETETFATNLADNGVDFGSRDEQPQYFRIPVSEGERIIASLVTTQPPSMGGLSTDSSRLQLSTAFTEISCWETDWGTQESIEAAGPQFMSVVSSVVGQDGCEDDELVLEVSRKGGFMAGEDLPGEIKITRLAGEDASDVPEPTMDGEVTEIAPAAEAEPVQPGTWFSDAAEIPVDGSRAVSATIVPGETHYYALDAAHGQTVSGVIETLGDAQEQGGVGEALDVQVVNEARQLAGEPAGHEMRTGEATPFGTAGPINYRNLTEADNYADRAFLPGRQYVMVEYDQLFGEGEQVGDTEQVETTYQLTMLVDGEATPGPTFTAAAAENTATATAPTTTQEETPESTEAAGEDPATETGGGIPWVWIAVILVVLALLAAVAFAVSRTRPKL